MCLEVAGLDERAIKIAHYILENRTSLTETGEVFGISKTTVGTDINKKVKRLDPVLYEQVKKVCDEIIIENRRKAGQRSASMSKNNIKFGKSR